MRSQLLALGLALALGGSACSTVRRCKTGTVLVSVTLSGTAADATTLDFDVSTDGAAAHSFSLTHTAGAATGTVEIDFPAGYPAGRMLAVTATARNQAGDAVASGGASAPTLEATCSTLAIALDPAADLAVGDLTGADLAGQPDLATGDGGSGPVLKRPSRSSAIAISDDDKTLAAVSPDDDLVYVFDTQTNTSTPVSMPSRSEPRSVAFAPDGSFWVANRGGGTLVQITFPGGTPTAGTPIAVGSEPTAVAVTPHGSKIVVANYVDNTVTIVPSGGGTAQTAPVGPNPRALAITNGGASDDAETVFVTQMFAQPVAGTTAPEGNDVGRNGVVTALHLGDLTTTPITLAPLPDTTFTAQNKAGTAIAVGAYPNQLQAIALHGGKAYIPSTAASPAAPINFAGNVHPFVSVVDLTSMAELPFGRSGSSTGSACGTVINNLTTGYGAGTVDLAIQARDLNGATTPPPVLVPTNPVDLDFVPSTQINVAYVLSMASDQVMRVVWDYAANTACAGSAAALAINLESSLGDFKAPIGIVVRNDGTQAYVNAWAGREVIVLDLANQSVSARLPLSAQPSSDPDKSILKGKKIFWTSTGRWSKNGWESCGSCHPDGLSDGVTWVFTSGPRQTLPLDAVFDHNDPSDQRILNWTGINDEIHDFEINTRNTSGGLGAIVSTSGGVDTEVDLTAANDIGVSGSAKQLAADATTPRLLNSGAMGTVNVVTAAAWDQVELYVQHIRSLHAPSTLHVGAGATLFQTGGCANCHAGPKWTTSRRPTTPVEGAASGSPTCSMETTLLAKKSVPTGGTSSQNSDQFQLERERVLGGAACTTTTACDAAVRGSVCTTGGLYCALAPQRLTCALRAVGTFGAGPQGAAFEVRSDTDASGNPLAADGVGGYNIPSLLSLAASAPYFHNGAAQTLTDIFLNSAFSAHRTAGNVNFAPTPGETADLVAYLLSIDPGTAALNIPVNLDLCNGSFTPNAIACTNP